MPNQMFSKKQLLSAISIFIGVALLSAVSWFFVRHGNEVWDGTAVWMYGSALMLTGISLGFSFLILPFGAVEKMKIRLFVFSGICALATAIALLLDL